MTLERTHTTTLAALVAACALVPLAHYGANRLASQAVAGAGVLVCVLLALSTREGRRSTDIAVDRMAPLLLAVVFACSVALVGSAFWSIEPGRAWDFVLPACLCLLALPAAVAAAGDRTTFVLLALVIVSAVFAAFGIASTTLGWNALVVGPKTDYLDWVTGPFVNRNAAADFFLLGLLSCFAAWKTRTSTSVLLVLLPAGLVLAAALLMTGSRAGVALAVLAALALAIFTPGRGRFAAIGLAAFAMPLAALSVLGRAGDAADSNLARVELWKDALSSIAERPLLGSGAGTYPALSVLERGDGVTPGFTWHSSHNLYLDTAATFGLPVTVLLVVCLIHGVFRLARSGGPLAPVGALAVSLVALHAIVDFSPSTPGVVLVLATLVGLCSTHRERISTCLAS